MSDLTTAQWHLTGYHYLETGVDSCQLCGHPIKQLYYVATADGHHKTVGSECVRGLLADDTRYTVGLIEKRAKRAARQWKDAKPAPKDGESKGDYVNRRVAEMANALSAYRVYGKRAREIDKAYKALCKQHADESRALFLAGDVEAQSAVYTRLWHEASELIFAEIEASCGANRFDFHRAVWEVRKI